MHSIGNVINSSLMHSLCTLGGKSRGAAEKQHCFGGAGEQAGFVVSDTRMREIARETEMRVKSGVSGGDMKVLGKDLALLDFALGHALDIAPRRPNGLWNVYRTPEGVEYRVRRVRKTGDVWVDRRNAGEKWNVKHFRESAVRVIMRLRGENPGLQKDYAQFAGYLSVLAKMCARDGARRGDGRIYSRRAAIRLMAKHPVLTMQTRALLGMVWCAGDGGGFLRADRRKRARLIMTAAGLNEEHSQTAMRAAALADDLPTTAGVIRWKDVMAWADSLFHKTAKDNRAAQFRTVWQIWRQCLSYEEGAWRWRGYHHFSSTGRRTDTGLSLRLAGSAGVCKKTAAMTLELLAAGGLISVAGCSVCLRAGVWGINLVRRIATRATTTTVAFAKKFHRFLRTFGGALVTAPPPAPA